MLGLLGPNGAGKTTTIEMIAGLIEPDAGRIEICGIDARAAPRAAKAALGVALQTTALQDQITPREALRQFGTFYGAPLTPAVLLERFGLGAKADARVNTLSGGQKQRLGLALAFVNDPRAVVLDEPTAGLDPMIRREVHDAILAMKREGCAVLLATHDMEEAVRLCDRVAIIAGGRIVAQGTPGDLIAASGPAVNVLVRTSSPVDESAVAQLSKVGRVVIDGDTLRFATGDLHRSISGLIAVLDQSAVRIVGVEAGAGTLEDLIVELTHRDAGR